MGVKVRDVNKPWILWLVRLALAVPGAYAVALSYERDLPGYVVASALLVAVGLGATVSFEQAADDEADEDLW